MCVCECVCMRMHVCVWVCVCVWVNEASPITFHGSIHFNKNSNSSVLPEHGNTRSITISCRWTIKQATHFGKLW